MTMLKRAVVGVSGFVAMPWMCWDLWHGHANFLALMTISLLMLGYICEAALYVLTGEWS